YYHELDSLNFLNSGKNWYGEELSTAPGHSTSMSFSLPVSNIIVGQPAVLVSSCVARSIGGNSRFSVTVSGTPVLQHDMTATGNTTFDAFATASQVPASFTPA